MEWGNFVLDSKQTNKQTWQAPVIPATWEAEAGESLEPREVEVAMS